MRHTARCVGLAIACTIACTIVTPANAAIQWSSAQGGNDHWYKLVLPGVDGPFLTWDEARVAAESDFLLGMQGHLVTVTSLGEHQFLESNYATLLNSPPNYPADSLWIGLTDRDVEGDFRWITGEPLSFTAWLPGEPNNSIGTGGWNPYGEDIVHYSRIRGTDSMGWNDHPGVPDPGMDGPYLGQRWGYIVEFEPGAVPEPASVAVWCGLGICVLTFARKRRRKA